MILRRLKILLILILITEIGILGFIYFQEINKIENLSKNDYYASLVNSQWDQNRKRSCFPPGHFPSNIKLELVGSYNTPGESEFVFVSGNLAYLADGFAGIQIFNVSQPENPELIVNYDTPGYSEGVFVSGNLAYISDKMVVF